ncbi:hypothetical protein ILYODFUR_021276 [Ilyodon furcidens]|uniref:Uncharacterized protein n=1 Tax=Ilyodon furcidens TaxID=33524 RepID=A0ABV0TYA1_9TELE
MKQTLGLESLLAHLCCSREVLVKADLMILLMDIGQLSCQPPHSLLFLKPQEVVWSFKIFVCFTDTFSRIFVSGLEASHDSEEAAATLLLALAFAFSLVCLSEESPPLLMGLGIMVT